MTTCQTKISGCLQNDTIEFIIFPVGNGNRLNLCLLFQKRDCHLLYSTLSLKTPISTKLKQLSPAVFIDDHWNERNGAAKNTLESFVSRAVSYKGKQSGSKRSLQSCCELCFHLLSTDYATVYSSPSAPDEGRQVVISEGRKIRDTL